MRFLVSAIIACLPAFVTPDVFNPDPSIFPDWSKTEALTPEHVIQTKQLGTFSLSPDKKRIVFQQYQYNMTDNKSGTEFKLLDLSSYSQGPTTLIPYKYDQSDSSPTWYDNETVLFTSVRGSPANNLFSVSARDGVIKQVSNFTNGISGIVYSSQAKRIAFVAMVYQNLGLEESAKLAAELSEKPSSGVVYDKLPVRSWDIWVTKQRAQLFTVPIDTVNETLVFTGSPVNVVAKYTGEWGLEPDYYTFSPDGSSILFSAKIEGREEAWQTEAGIFIAPVDGSSAPVRLNSNFKGAASSPNYSPDGKSVVWLQMATPGYESDQNQVILYDIATQKQTRLLSDLETSPSYAGFSSSGKSLYLIIPTQKDNPIFVFDLATQTLSRRVADGAIADLVEVSDDELIISHSTVQHPSNLFKVSTKGNISKTQITFENDNLLKGLWMSPAETFWFTGALNEKVQAFVLYPFGFDKSKKYPISLIIHGGPQSSFYDQWSVNWNLNSFANQGYIVLLINFHGGDAYGQKFTDSITHNWGTYPYEDLMTGLDYFLENAKYADGNNVAALGASYGGYMANWINGQTDRFKALVCHDGVFSTVSVSYSTDYFSSLDHDLGIAYIESQRNMLEKFNPERYVSNWKTPTLVVQGEYDYRVPVTEGISTFAALQRRGIDSKLLYFPDENHMVLKPANYLFWTGEMFNWIGKYTNVTTWEYKNE
ncbi:hypothetical protein BB560_005588 [Smittium megazygosporum]|uniref:Dipeptidyl-peptidase V n=1 Tax=Smittium megazygosporum TaxID=133381 RepID=A0A2T9Z2V2_9FUNG|nr:hypothetical protein BB560_005588 [Smittium megazygosporum]